MEATVGVEISSRRAEQRKAEAEGEAHYIAQTGKAEAEKVRLMGEAQGVAYREQVNALGPQGVALVETLKVIGEKVCGLRRTCWLRVEAAMARAIWARCFCSICFVIK